MNLVIQGKLVHKMNCPERKEKQYYDQIELHLIEATLDL